MSTEPVLYGVFDPNQFCKMRFSYVKGQKSRMKLQYNLFKQGIRCQLYHQPPNNLRKISFEYNPDSFQGKNVPITNIQCSDKLMGYLADYGKIQTPAFQGHYLGIVRVSDDEKPDFDYFATVKIIDIVNSFTSASQIENDRKCGKDEHHIISPVGPKYARCNLPQKHVLLHQQPGDHLYDIQINEAKKE